jgi:hypothetical protein
VKLGVDAVYERTTEQIATAIDMLLNHQHLTACFTRKSHAMRG